MKKMKKALLLVTTALLALSGTARASNVNMYASTLTYSLGAGYEIPLGDFDGRLDNGISGSLSFQYVLPVRIMESFLWWKYYFLDLNFRYLYTALSESPKSSISWYSGDIGPVLYYPLSRWVAPYIGASIGGFYSSMTLDALDKTETTYDMLARAKAGLIIPATSSLSLRMEGSYNYHRMDPSPYKSAGVSMYISYNFSGDIGNEISKGDSQVQVINTRLKEIYAIRFMQYNSEGIGSITIKNTGSDTLYNVRVDFKVDKITEDTKSTEEIKTLEPGGVKMLLLPVTITEKAYSVSEDRKISVRCRIVYGSSSSKNYFTEVWDVPFYNKNAITWDKTEHLGSFIMPHDATVSMFARKALSDAEDAMIKGIPRKLLAAMALFDAMHTYGMVYASDPGSGYAAASSNKQAVDYVQLPSETLRKKAGDCDDLTALYASLLENVGINTAIATVPGHVFLLFNTEVPESCADELCEDRGLYVVRDRALWIPVEVTALRGSFVQAWKDGARQAQGRAFDCMETIKAWENFPPAVSETEYDIDHPAAKKLSAVVASDISVLKGLMYDDKVRVLLAEVKSDPKSYKALNELGIIYGKFAQIAEAEDCFTKSLRIMPSYFPALTNMGNVCMLQKKFAKAAEYYAKALEAKPDDVNARINHARALYELKSYAKAREEYGKAVSVNPGLSVRYGYLARSADAGGTSGRASFTAERYELNMWSEGL